MYSFANLRSQQQDTAESKPSFTDQLKELLRTDYTQSSQPSFDGGKNLLEMLLNSEFVPAASAPIDDGIKRKKKRKKHEYEQSNGISR